MTSVFSLAGASLASASAAEGGVNLDFDLTFLGQMVAFTVLVIILKPVLFDPLMKLFEERERRTEGAKLLARKMDEQAGQILKKYETELDKIRRVAAEEREKLRAEGQRLEAQILADARREALKIMDEGKAKLAGESAAIRRELQARASDVAREVAALVLGREVGSGP